MPETSPSKLQPVLVGGAVSGVGGAIPIVNLLCCGWPIIGGMMAAYLYGRDRPPSVQPPYRDGLILGLLIAPISSAVWVLGQLLLRLLGVYQALPRPATGFNLPFSPLEIFAPFGTGDFSSTQIAAFVMSLVLDAVFASVGALIGFAIFHKQNSAQSPPAPPTASPTT